MKHETCWNGKPFKLIKKPEKPTLKIGFARYVAMVHKHNIMWLNYIDGWEKYAKKLGKEYLFDEYEKYLAMREY